MCCVCIVNAMNNNCLFCPSTWNRIWNRAKYRKLSLGLGIILLQIDWLSIHCSRLLVLSSVSWLLFSVGASASLESQYEKKKVHKAKTQYLKHAGRKILIWTINEWVLNVMMKTGNVFICILVLKHEMVATHAVSAEKVKKTYLTKSPSAKRAKSRKCCK